jgi:hypothetical protein
MKGFVHGPLGSGASVVQRPWNSIACSRGLAVAAVIVAGWLWLAGGQTAAQRPAPPESVAPGGLWISASPLDESRRLLLVIDPQFKNAAVYHLEAATGALTLKSTRDISYDLMVGDFNAQAPKPADLKKMLDLAPARR